MTLKRGSKLNCGNSVTTSRGTYTFYDGRKTKHEATQLCEKNGGILAPLNTKEEFDAVHKFAFECTKWTGYSPYHIGLYVIDKETRLFTDCEKWDSEKHDKLYSSSLDNGPFFDTYYNPADKIMSIGSGRNAHGNSLKTICFKAAKQPVPSAVMQSENTSPFTSTSVVAVGIALVGMVAVLGVAFFRSLKKIRKLQQELPTSSQ